MFPDLALSLCGPLDLNQPPSTEAFSAATISHAEFRQNPSLLEHPALVVRMHGRLQTWREAAPEVLSLLIFQQPLTTQEPSPTVAETNAKQELLASEAQPKEGEESQVDNQVVPASEGEHQTSSEVMPSSAVTTEETEPTQQGYSWFPWRRSGSNTSKKPEPAGNTTPGGTGGMAIGGYRSSDEDELAELTAEARGKDMTSHIKEGEGYSGSNSSDESETGTTRGINIPGARLRLFEVEGEVAYRKSLRLSSEQIGSLMLKEGANEVVFSVTTAYQGTSRCKCHVYRWRWDDKIVISDIDGTITKSDVLGHILPIVGKDWAQSGVAQLFTKIKNNGYRLLYLSARAIGQARVTREYLKSIKQGDLSLPEGPLLLSPTSLISAFHREVIEKKPEEFKISCLRDIQALFPPECKPFYAGYGNKINDVWAYRAVGIPIFRIFTINHKGELKHELTQTFQSSYSNMSYIVDQMFPPTEDSSAADDYNSFNYWREPIPELDPALLPPAPASPTAKGKTPLKESPSAVTTAK
ncbi:UNVERIFIED_CONTAM: hypothetical protein B566_EDAN018306 [Ephemera danica]|nr:hypothetical protein B566_EDAN018306 [Ephemera danica]